MIEQQYQRKYEEIGDIYTEDTNKRQYGETYPYYVVEFETLDKQKISFELNFDGNLIILN